MPVGGAFSSLLQSFRKRTIRIGRGYQGQSFALIALCRHLVENDTSPRDDGLQTILQFADEALLAAEKAGKNKTSEADSAFQHIRTKLRVFPMPTTESSQKLFKNFMGAESKDEVTTNLIKKADEKSSPTPKAGPSTKVTFVLRKSLHEDTTQIIFQKKLENTTTIPEFLWILRHEEDDKRITWKQNPHFYSRLPNEASYFGRNFHHEPLKDDDFREALVSHSDPIYILSDKPCRLHLDDTTNPRVFGNVWQPHHTFILKDICGILDSADNVPSPNGFDFFYRHAPQPPESSSHSLHSDVLRQIREETSWDWLQVLRAASLCQDIDLMVRANGWEDVPGWNRLTPPRPPPPRLESQISRARAAPASTSTPPRSNSVPVDRPVDSFHSANARRDAENSQRHVHSIDSTRDGRSTDSQSNTSRKPQGLGPQNSLSSEARKLGERPSQREHPTRAGGFAARSASQTLSSSSQTLSSSSRTLSSLSQTFSPSSPASTHTSSATLDDVLVDSPTKIPQDRLIAREDPARGQGHVHANNSTQSRVSSNTQGPGQQSLSSEVQKPAEHFLQRVPARAFLAHSATQPSSPRSASTSTPTSSARSNDVSVDVPAKISQDRPIVRENASRGQGHVHAINSVQSCVSSNLQGPSHQSLSSEVQKLAQHPPQREITARASPAHSATQPSSPPSASTSTPTSSGLVNVRNGVPVNKPQDRPVVREDAATGQGHVHAISNTRGGRPIDSQSRTSSYPQGSDIQSPLSSEAQKPRERFQEKHVITPGKSTTRYAGWFQSIRDRIGW